MQHFQHQQISEQRSQALAVSYWFR